MGVCWKNLLRRLLPNPPPAGKFVYCRSLELAKGFEPPTL